jgi:hypothetical protein
MDDAEALPTNVNNMDISAIRAGNGGRLMSEMTARISHTITTGRPIRHALLGDCAITGNEHDPSRVYDGIRRRRLRDADAVHRDGRIVPVDDDRLIARGNTRAEMKDLAVPRLARSVAGFAADYRRDRHPAVRD